VESQDLPPVAPEPAPPEAPEAMRQSAPGVAIAGFVCGVLAVLSPLPMPFLSVPLAILGIVFGAIGSSQANQRGAPKGLATAAVVCGALALVIVVALYITTGYA
jgi:hypothetical protein